jgi:hypothetical protein
MKFKIKKGRHWPGLIGWFATKWIRIVGSKPFIISRVIEFTNESKYDLPLAEDMSDVNKLFGVCFGDVHKDSARFGWNFDKESGKFLLYSYCYINGRREFEYLGEVGFWDKVIAPIEVNENCYLFSARTKHMSITNEFRVNKSHNKKIATGLGFWFGGKNPAPKEVVVKISKL